MNTNILSQIRTAKQSSHKKKKLGIQETIHRRRTTASDGSINAQLLMNSSNETNSHSRPATITQSQEIICDTDDNNTDTDDRNTSFNDSISPSNIIVVDDEDEAPTSSNNNIISNVNNSSGASSINNVTIQTSLLHHFQSNNNGNRATANNEPNRNNHESVSNSIQSVSNSVQSVSNSVQSTPHSSTPPNKPTISINSIISTSTSTLSNNNAQLIKVGKDDIVLQLRQLAGLETNLAITDSLHKIGLYLNNNFMTKRNRRRRSNHPRSSVSRGTSTRHRTNIDAPVSEELFEEEILSMSVNLYLKSMENWRRCYIEDFMILSAGSHVRVLIPSNTHDTNENDSMIFIGVDSYKVVECVIKSAPSGTMIKNGMSTIDIKHGFGCGNFGAIVESLETTLDYRNKSVPVFERLITWKEVQKCNYIVAALDNNQRGNVIKYQRGGASNKFVKVTGRFFRKCNEFDIAQENASREWIDERVEISYTDQAIPSMYMMPAMEGNMFGDDTYIDCPPMCEKILRFSSLNNKPIDPDFTGRRVDSYFEMIETCFIITRYISRFGSNYVSKRKQYKEWEFTPSRFKSPFRINLAKHLSKEKKDELKIYRKFQHQMMKRLIPSLDTDESKLLIPEVSQRDEIKTCEYGMAVIEMLVLSGILIETTNENGAIMWKASPKYETKMVYLFVDGLSFDRHRYFVKRLTKIEASFLDNYKSLMSVG